VPKPQSKRGEESIAIDKLRHGDPGFVKNSQSLTLWQVLSIIAYEEIQKKATKVERENRERER